MQINFPIPTIQHKYWQETGNFLQLEKSCKLEHQQAQHCQEMNEDIQGDHTPHPSINYELHVHQKASLHLGSKELKHFHRFLMY